MRLSSKNWASVSDLFFFKVMTETPAVERVAFVARSEELKISALPSSLKQTMSLS